MAKFDLNIICKRANCEHAMYRHLWRTVKFSRHHEVGICKVDDCKCIGFVLSMVNAIGPGAIEEGSV